MAAFKAGAALLFPKSRNNNNISTKPTFHFGGKQTSKSFFFSSYLFASNFPKRNTFVERYLNEGKVAPPLEHTIPTFVNGLWRKPTLNNRKFKLLKNRAIAQGFEFVDPKPVVEKKPNPENFQRTPKGHRWEEAKEKRLATIKKKMKEMPKLIEEYRAANKKKREAEVKPIQLFWPHPILPAPRRISRAKSQRKIREERKQRRRESKAKKKAATESGDSAVASEKKKKVVTATTIQMTPEQKAASRESPIQKLLKGHADPLAAMVARAKEVAKKST